MFLIATDAGRRAVSIAEIERAIIVGHAIGALTPAIDAIAESLGEADRSPTALRAMAGNRLADAIGIALVGGANANELCVARPSVQELTGMNEFFSHVNFYQGVYYFVREDAGLIASKFGAKAVVEKTSRGFVVKDVATGSRLGPTNRNRLQPTWKAPR